MFIDDINYRYTYINTLKNIVLEDPISTPPYEGVPVTLHSELDPVMDRLFKERPTWRYKSVRHSYRNTHPRVTDLEIYDGDEKLGRLWLDYHWDGTPQFKFTNFRIEKSRQRSGPSYSTKPDVTAKRIIKAFHLKTPRERASEAAQDVVKLINSLRSNAGWELRRAKSRIEAELFSYALRHWEQVQPALGGCADGIDLAALVEHNEQSLALSDAFTGGGGVTVRVESNGTYLVARRGTTAEDSYSTETHTDSSLSDHVRGALGLLKMLPDNTHIPNVGLRVDANLFFVMDASQGSDGSLPG